MKRAPLGSTALWALLPTGLVGCGGALDTHDRSPNEIVATCSVSSNGERSVLVVHLRTFEDRGRIDLHPKDAILTHDASGVHPLAPYDAWTKRVEDEVSVTKEYAGSIPAAVPPTLAFRIDDAEVHWMTLPLPAAPDLEIRDRKVRWSPSAEGKVALYATCSNAKPPSQVEPSYSVQHNEVAIEKGATSVDLEKIEAKLGVNDYGRCPNITFVAVRRRELPAADLGLHPSSTCTVEQVRSLEFGVSSGNAPNTNQPAIDE